MEICACHGLVKVPSDHAISSSESHLNLIAISSRELLVEPVDLTPKVTAAADREADRFGGVQDLWPRCAGVELQVTGDEANLG